ASRGRTRIGNEGVIAAIGEHAADDLAFVGDRIGKVADDVDRLAVFQNDAEVGTRREVGRAVAVTLDQALVVNDGRGKSRTFSRVIDLDRAAIAVDRATGKVIDRATTGSNAFGDVGAAVMRTVRAETLDVAVVVQGHEAVGVDRVTV